jgi:hypothetical protein
VPLVVRVKLEDADVARRLPAAVRRKAVCEFG